MSAAALILALALGAPPPESPEDHLDHALRCARKGDFACAASESQAAVDSPDPAVARDARAVLAVALARTDRAADAALAFDRLLDVYPAWRPPPDADPRVVAAFEDARHTRLRRLLPTTLTPGPPAAAPRPPAEAIVKLLPQPRLYIPPIDRAPPRFALSLGAGVGIPSSDRVGPGLDAAVDFRWLAGEHLALWIQGTLALLPLNDTLPVEPGHGRGLTAFSLAAGVELRLPVAEQIELLAAVGLGFGGFGYDRPGDAAGLAIAGAVGVRWQADRNLALRLDLAPITVVPIETGVGPGGHLAILLRGETRF